MLKLSYQVIVASVPLMEVAHRRALSLSSGDPVASGLAEYLDQHIEEERGHDQWLSKDLLVLGISPDTLNVPSPIIAGMVGAQYYWALHAHPVSILGYLAVLEGEPADESFFADKAERSDLPEAAFNTLKYHARVDRDHWNNLLDLVDRLPLTAPQETLIGLSVLHTCQGMESAIRSVLELPAPQTVLGD